MLQNLQIKNYAIIDEIGISFSNGLNVITGETGAGKSILMGALSLILGERADTSVLLDKETKCFIEGSFKTNHELVKKFLKENDLEGEDDIVIRREIATNGKSRAFVNDSPVNLNILKELSSLLVDLHQQFDTLELGDNNFQREVIDALANHSNALREYHQVFKKYTSAQKQLAALKLQQTSANKELDYQNFLFNELEEANFSDDELEQGEAALKTLNNAENIKSTLNTIYSVLQENELPLIQQIKSLNNQLATLKNFHPGIQVLTERLHSTQVELQDIADELDHLNNSVSFSEEKINTLNERLALGYRLLKKHGVRTTTDLLSIKNELRLKLDQISDLAEIISREEIMVNEYLKQAREASENISANRHKQIKPFEQKVNILLSKVGMPNAKIKVVMETTELNYYGSDSVEFLFDANNSGRFEPLRKVASGGELSRLMLCIKSLVAKSVQLPTLIFDEIDTGISGEAARQVAIIMKELSVAHQLISITHQPQIAAKAEAHYFVYKEIKGDKIATAIKLLDRDEQITTIATMLSGERPTAAAFANAREMIGN